MEQTTPWMQSLLRPCKFANYEKGIFSKKFPGIDAEINEPTPIQDAATGYTDYSSKSNHDLPEDDLLGAFYVPFHKDSMTCYHKTSSLIFSWAQQGRAFIVHTISPSCHCICECKGIVSENCWNSKNKMRLLLELLKQLHDLQKQFFWTINCVWICSDNLFIVIYQCLSSFPAHTDGSWSKNKRKLCQSQKLRVQPMMLHCNEGRSNLDSSSYQSESNTKVNQIAVQRFE